MALKWQPLSRRKFLAGLGVTAGASWLRLPLAWALTPPVLSGSQVGSNVNLSWTDSGDEKSYLVKRSTNNVTFPTIATLGANVHAYTDPNPTPGSYWYRVDAKKGNQVLPSNVVPLTVTGGGGGGGTYTTDYQAAY
jgi:phosphodiesterase/alkaline phosphatase D-like protein